MATRGSAVPRRLRDVVALATVVIAAVSCGLDHELATRLEDQVRAFDAPQTWAPIERGDGPYRDEGFELLYGGPFCSSAACLHAVAGWTLPDGPPDVDEVDAAVARTDGWDVVHVPDCVIADPEAQDVRGCAWEADVDDLYVVVELTHRNTSAPWSVTVSSYTDDHHDRDTNSPLQRRLRRDAAAGLVAAADRFAPPASWRLISDEVLPTTDGCSESACLEVLRTWFDVPPVRPAEVSRLLQDAGWQGVHVDGSCRPDPAATRPHVVCTLDAVDDATRATIEVTSVGDVHEVDLRVAPR